MIDTLRNAASTLSDRAPTRAQSAVGWLRDEETSLSRIRTLSKLLDDSIPIPGTDKRIGLDPIVGMLPVAGDTVTALLSLYIVGEGALMGVPRSVLGRMLLNVAIDTVVGFVPFIGDIFDATWKANQRNVDLIERYADDRGIEAADGRFDLL